MTTQGPGDTFASPKEQFDLLYGQLKDGFEALIDYEFRHGVIVVAMSGWVFTSRQAQETVTGSLAGTIIATIFLLCYTAGHAYWAGLQFRRSRILRDHLKELGYVRMEHVEPKVIKKSLVWSFCLFHGFTAGLLVAFIWMVRSQAT